MFFRTMFLALFLTVIWAPAAEASTSGDGILDQHPLMASDDERVGWKAHDRSYYELGYVHETSAWATNGLQNVRLSGIRFHEHRGILANLPILLLFQPGGPFEDILKAAAKETTKTMGMNFTSKELEKARDGLMKKMWDDRTPPLSMDLQLFSAELGSQMTGIIGEIGISGSYMLVDDVFVALWSARFTASWLWANHLFVPSSDLNTPIEDIERRWIGLSFSGQLLVPDFEYVGLLARFTTGYSKNPLLLLEFGPEVLVGDRFQLRGLATKDFGSDAPFHARFEVGVRF